MIGSSFESDIKTRLDAARMNVRAIVAASDHDARGVLARYAAAIEGNFVSWMGAATIAARFVQARFAASENLWVEMKDDHAGMLAAFVLGADATPQPEDDLAVRDAVASIRQMVKTMSGVKIIALMAFLENTSAEFIPLLERLALERGATNLTYTNTHGEADAMHADQFAWALAFECEQASNALADVDATFTLVTDFLRAIFHPQPTR